MKLHVFAALCSIATAAAQDAEKGFTPLFNGRDLHGWVNVNCAPETWSVRDGVIHCTGKPTGALRTERHYENFVFELEWRHLRPGGNAGVFIWASPIAARGVPFLRAIEVQVLDHGRSKSESHTTHGDVFPIHGSTMKPFGRSKGMRSFPSEERSKGSPEWNHYRIVADAGVLRLHVNGKDVSGGEDCVWRKGYLALESEGSPVEFRNLRLKELPSTGAGAEQSAPLDQGWKPLYNGLDLRGWRAPQGPEPVAVANDWRLVVEPAAPETPPLWTEQELGDFELVVDCRSPRPAGGTAEIQVLLRGRDGRGVPVALPGLTAEQAAGVVADAKFDATKWNRYSVSVRKNTAVVELNGVRLREQALGEDAPARGGDWSAECGRENRARESVRARAVAAR